MKRSRRWLMTLSVILSPGVIPALQAQGLQLYGSVDVGKLPPPGHYAGKLKHHKFYVSDSDGLKKKKEAAESGSLSSSGAGPVNPTASSISIGPGAGFDGMSLADSSLLAVPPDTQVAAGAGFVVEAVNINVRIWNMNVSPPAVTDFDLVSFFGLFFSDVVSDPRIRFDPVQQRWYLSCVSIEQTFVNPPQGDFRLAVSPGSDPTQTFNLYAATTTGSFPDYPHLGFNDDKLVLTGNSFALPLSNTSQFLGTEFLVVSKSDLVNPAVTSPAAQFFAAPQGLDTIQPAESLSSTCNAGICTLFMAAVPDASLPPPANILRIWSVGGVPGVGGGVTFTTTDLSIPLLSIPPGAVQQGSTNLIETNDARLLDAIFRDGSLWVSSTTGCQPSGDTPTRACLHFSQVNTSPISLTQDLVFGQPGEYFYYPAIQIDSNDNLVAVFNRSSATEYPSIYVSGQPAGAAPGTFAALLSVFEGQFPLTPSSSTFNRWGDYSGAGLDSSGTVVWVAAEYVHSASNDDWGTFIAPVQFNASTLSPTTTTIGSSTNPSTFGQQVTFTATVTSGAGTPTGTVTFKDGATTLGTGTLNASDQATFNSSSLAAGSHSITAVYGGDSNFTGSTSSILTQGINQASSNTALSSSANPSAYGQAVTFTATVTSAGGTPTGAVTFKDGAITLGAGTLNASGQATFNSSSLAVGSHSITAVYGGDSNFTGSTSSILTQSVSQASTNTALSSSLNPSSYGQSVTFTATITSGAGTPTGAVNFKDAATILGTRTLNASGQATFSTTSLSAASHSITVVYGGAGNFGGSTSPILTQVVNQASTNTVVSSSLNPSTYGQSVMFTATVTSGVGTPTGAVTFKDAATILGTRTLNASGQATLSTTNLSAASHSITVVYGGAGNFGGSTSPILTQVVNQASTNTVLSSSLNPSTYGQSVTFTATVTSGTRTPTGTVTFMDGTNKLGTGTLSGSGQVTFSTISLSAASHSITAVYGGTVNFGGSTSAPITQAVNQESTNTALSSNLNPATYGQSITFKATVTSGTRTPAGTVTFLDGTTTLGTGTLGGSGQATFNSSTLAAGSHSITAVYGGTSNFLGSTSAPIAQVINQASTNTVLSSNLNPSTYGQSVTFLATITSGTRTPTGTVAFMDGTTTLQTRTLNASGQASFSTTSLSAASHSITAVYGGTTNFIGSTSAPITQTVNQASTITTVTSSLNPSRSGQSVTFKATVTSKAGTPIGSVTFNDGSTVLTTGSLDGSGQATFSTSGLSVGAHSITAVYGGSTNLLGSTSLVLTQTVNP